jgi:hypothetical protein
MRCLLARNGELLGQSERYPVVARHNLVLLSAVEALCGGPASVEQRRSYDGLANHRKIKNVSAYCGGATWSPAPYGRRNCLLSIYWR